MDTIFMNSEDSRASKYVLILKLTDKLDLRRGEKSIALSNLGKTKAYKIIINLEYQLQHGMMNLNYLMDHT